MRHGPAEHAGLQRQPADPRAEAAIIDYVADLEGAEPTRAASARPLGPVTEGLVIWVVGIGALMLMILWIGAKS